MMRIPMLLKRMSVSDVGGGCFLDLTWHVCINCYD